MAQEEKNKAVSKLSDDPAEAASKQGLEGSEKERKPEDCRSRESKKTNAASEDAMISFYDIYREYRQQKEKIKKLEQSNRELKALYNKAVYDNKALLNSLSWKITKPVRTVADGVLIVSRVYPKKKEGLLNSGYPHSHSDKAPDRVTDGKDSGREKGIKAADMSPSIPISIRMRHLLNRSDEDSRIERLIRWTVSVKFSIVVPLYNTPKAFLIEMIESVLDQTYQNWELCMADGSTADGSYVETICRRYQKKDKRIRYKRLEKNNGISENTNACLELATGDYICLLDHDDLLHPSALFEMMFAIEGGQADLIYTDEVVFNSPDISDILTYYCKGAYSPFNLLSNNYFCHFVCFKRSLLQGEGFRREYDGSQDHDLMLRLTERAHKVVHIPRFLYFWRSHKASTAQNVYNKDYVGKAGIGAVQSALQRRDEKGTVISVPEFPVIYRVNYEIIGEPLVSVIVSSAAESSVSAGLKTGTWKKYEVSIRNSNDDPVNSPYADLQTEGEYLLFLSDNVQSVSEDLIREMLQYAQRDDVGAVGGMVRDREGNIFSSGVAVGVGRQKIAARMHYGCDQNSMGYMGRLLYTQEVTALTGDCFMISKRKLEEVGGFTETYRSELVFVDLCMKLRKRGYRIVWTPYAAVKLKTLCAPEGEYTVKWDKEDARRFYRRWKRQIAKGDPFYNPNFGIILADFDVQTENALT